MRVQHNITAMNSYRNYNGNTSVINKNIEKLSSGYKINRAGDDAAGLAISEKMRAQITGLEGAQKNAKDGISLVQTAEGALTEVHSMLNRMYSLAEQSANGTYDKSLDRQQLQKEVDKLRTEIDRISDSSNFNGIPLLDGRQQVRSANAVELARDLAGALKTDVSDEATFKFTHDTTNAKTDEVKAAVNEALSGVHIALKAEKGTEIDKLDNFSVSISKDGVTETFDGPDKTESGIKSGDYWVTIDKSGTIEVFNDDDGEIGTTSYGKFSTLALNTGTDFKAGYVESDGKTAAKDVIIQLNLFSENEGMQLQIGDTAADYNQMKVDIGNIASYNLGLDGCNGAKNSIATVDISTQKGAADALNVIKAAINNVSDVRGTLGATQNRLEHTINNLSVMQTNIQDAESTIRDTDVADEMMKYTKNSILVQSAQAMLAQANQQPQGVLQLLQ